MTIELSENHLAPVSVGEWNEPQGIAARGTLIVIGGHGETPQVYERFGTRLARDAYRVRALGDPTLDPAATRAAVEALLADPSLPAPKVLVGSDVGAAIALELAVELQASTAKRPSARGSVDAVVLAGIPGRASAATEAHDADGDGSDQPADEAIAARTACPNHQGVLRRALVPGGQTPTLPFELLGVLASAVRVPVLAVHGADDAISPASAAVEVYAEAPRAEIYSVEGGRHDILNDVTHRSVAATIVLFLERLRATPDATPLVSRLADSDFVPVTPDSSLATLERTDGWLQPLLDAVPAASLGVPADTGRATDRSGVRAVGHPLAVVSAQSVDDVVATLRFASQNRVPVVTRGAGSGLAGGAVAGAAEIVLDLSGLRAIGTIDAVDGTVYVEPGVITADLDAAAAAQGLFYAPDPGSVAISTVGGNIATNAGGLRGAKYGVTRDAVLALDVVLADGRLLRVGPGTVKGVVGYDLLGLFVGSEGTLGVVVGAVLRLLPRPATLATAAAVFDTVEQAALASISLATAGVRPVLLEVVDAQTLSAVRALRGEQASTGGGALLLVQTDGFGALDEIGIVADVLRLTARSVDITDDAVTAARLTAARRDALPAIEARGRVLIEDIAVPRSRLADAFAGVASIADRTGVEIFTFAHAADANLHPIILIPDEEAGSAVTPRADAAAAEIFALALELGGTVSAEHGVGLLKRDWIEREVGEDARRLLHSVKALFDPLGILNPGKAI